METQDNKTIIRRFVEEIENTGDITNNNEFISEDYAEVHNGERFQIGIKELLIMFRGCDAYFLISK